MQLRQQLNLIKRWSWLVIAGTVAAALVSLAVSNALPKMYESTATVLVGQALQSSTANQSQILASQDLARTYAEIAVLRPTLERAIADLKLDTTFDDLQDRVTAEAQRENTLATITVTDKDPETAAAIANEIAANLIDVSRQQTGASDAQAQVDKSLENIQGQITTTNTQIGSLLALSQRTVDQERRLDTLRARTISLWSSYSALVPFSSGASPNGLSLIAPAVPADDPSSPRILLNVLLAAVAGLLLSIALAVALEHLDDTVKTAENVNELTGLPNLGTVGRLPGPDGAPYRLTPITYPRSTAAEAYRTLRTNVEFAGVDAMPRSILVTSGRRQEGKSITAANLALVFAQAGKRTILIDADLRKPSVHDLFGVSNRVGLSDLLRGDPGSETLAFHPTQEPDLIVVPTGPLPPNPAELLGSHQMRALLTRLLERADLIIFDSPPIRAVTDALVIATTVDATILVAEAGGTPSSVLRDSKEALDRVGARVLGVWLNRPKGRASMDAYPYPNDGAPDQPATLGGEPEPHVTRPVRDAGSPGRS